MKRQDKDGTNTLASVYFYDNSSKAWVHEATISCPNGNFPSVKTFGGGMNAFLENWSGAQKAAPKLALYRLWVGTKPSNLTSVTSAGGDGKWGVLDGSFYLAEGDDSGLRPVFARLFDGNPLLKGEKNATLTIPASRIPKSIVQELERLDPVVSVKSS